MINENNKKAVLDEEICNKSMANAIMAQALGVVSNLVFKNGFMLAYLSAIGVSSDMILVFLSIPEIFVFLSTLPSAFFCDKVGNKKIGVVGLAMTILGFLLISLSSILILNETGKTFFFVIGSALFGIGYGAFSSGWFALLAPIVPERIRGRFFGKLRMIWQGVSIAFSFFAVFVLKKYVSLNVFTYLLLLITCFAALRLVFYIRIKEIRSNENKNNTDNFINAILEVCRIPGYMPFCAYVFIITLFTGACPWLFGLLQKDTLGFSSGMVVLMGNLTAIGTFVGFLGAGRWVDRFGAKIVFMINHFAYAAILFAFTLRTKIPLPVHGTIGMLCFLFGICVAATSIAISTEMLAITPPVNKALSTAFIGTLQTAGISLSGILTARMISLGILSPQWKFFGDTLGVYDSIILGSAIMILLMVVTLGLIPSLIKPAHWTPYGENHF